MSFLGFGKKKDKKDSKDKSKDKKLEDKKEDLSQVASGNVKVKIYMTFGGNVNTLKDEFQATQVRDGVGGLLFYNEDKRFMEDCSFERADVFRELKTILEIKEKSKEQQLKILGNKIDRQKKTIAYLIKHVKLNAVFNFADEELKLRDLQILRKHIANTSERVGAFYTLENGVRTYSFFKEDGFFYPIWNGADNYTTYPDYTRKRKVHIGEATLFNKEWEHKLKRLLPPATLITTLIILVLLVLANMYLGATLMNKHSQIDKEYSDKMHGQAFQCIEYTSAINKQMATFLNNEIVQVALAKKNLTKETFSGTNKQIVNLNPELNNK